MYALMLQLFFFLFSLLYVYHVGKHTHLMVVLHRLSVVWSVVIFFEHFYRLCSIKRVETTQQGRKRTFIRTYAFMEAWIQAKSYVWKCTSTCVCVCSLFLFLCWFVLHLAVSLQCEHFPSPRAGDWNSSARFDDLYMLCMLTRASWMF